MNSLFKDGRYTHSLFFGHLYLEKICKALWVRNNNGNTPPYIHKLVNIITGTENNLIEDDILFLTKLNEYQLKGRYPEYTNNLKKITTKEYEPEQLFNKKKKLSKIIFDNIYSDKLR